MSHGKGLLIDLIDDDNEVFGGLEPILPEMALDPQLSPPSEVLSILGKAKNDDDEAELLLTPKHAVDGSGSSTETPSHEISTEEGNHDENKQVMVMGIKFDANGYHKPILLPEVEKLMKLSRSSSVLHEAQDEGSISSQLSKRRRGPRGRRPFKWPEWLPSDWIIFEIARSSGRSKGHIDKYYEAPEKHWFRSKIEVIEYLNKEEQKKQNFLGVTKDEAQNVNGITSDPGKMKKSGLRIQLSINGRSEVKYDLV